MRWSLSVLLMMVACAGSEPGLEMVVVTFNSGTTMGLGHDDPPDDGYGDAEAELSDMYYGDGLAWNAAIDDTRAFFAEVDADVVVFQEIFHPEACDEIPADAIAGFYCEGWTAGAPTVAQAVMGNGYQVACNPGKPDKCAAVKRSFGSFRGCDDDLCLEGLDGATVAGCGSGSRVGRGVIELASGGAITVVNVHGSSGLRAEDQACRVAQFDQVFLDLDGAPAASGGINVVMGDLNTDPGRVVGSDDSADRFVEYVGDGKRFHFVSEVGVDAPRSYQGVLDIDHVVSDGLEGTCTIPGVVGERGPITDMVYFDHKPVVCTIAGDAPR